MFESELARVLAEQWSIPYVNLAALGVDRSCLMLMTPELGRRCAAVPVRFFGSELRVAFADPSDPDVVAEVQSQMAALIQPAIAELSEHRCDLALSSLLRPRRLSLPARPVAQWPLKLGDDTADPFGWRSRVLPLPGNASGSRWVATPRNEGKYLLQRKAPG